jgi:plastocyanin
MVTRGGRVQAARTLPGRVLPSGRRVMAALCLAAVAAACGGSEEKKPAPAAATEPPPPPIDPATVASVSGHIALHGTPPKAERIQTKSDPNCKEPVFTQTFLVGTDGSLGNVFVYVKSGLGNRTFPAPATPVVLSQKNCTYAPHVLGMMAGQPLELRNEDPTLHNIHAVPENNREFNMAQQIQGMRQQHTFSAAEVLIPFKCDVHNWMRAYVGVLDHPFFAVTGADGSFEIKGLPPGTYEIEAVHEKLGRQAQTITVGPKESKTDVAFNFKV